MTWWQSALERARGVLIILAVALTACPAPAPCPEPVGCHDEVLLVMKENFHEKNTKCSPGQTLEITEGTNEWLLTCRCPKLLTDHPDLFKDPK